MVVGLELSFLYLNVVLALLWIYVGGISLAIAAPVILKIMEHFWNKTGMSYAEELKNGNIAVAIVISSVLFAVIIGYAVVVSSALPN